MQGRWPLHPLTTGRGSARMGKAVTIRDIAKEASVSPATVSRFLNKNGYVDQLTGQRIAAAVERFSYHPNRIAQSLKTKETKNLVLVVPDIQNPFYSRMANETQHLLLTEGYTTTLFDTEGSYDSEMKALALAHGIGADGILFASVAAHKTVLRELQRMNVPVVMINSYDACPFDSVHGVRGQGTYLSTHYLISLGHTRIGFAGGARGTAIAASRKNGYLQAMREAGLPVDEQLIFEMDFNSDAGRKSGTYFSALEQLPTAICCANDMIALGLQQTLVQRGLRVPGDISLTGMDNVPFGDLCNPPLTTVTNDSAEFAQRAVRALLERMRGLYAGPPREFLVGRQLIVRGSAAPARPGIPHKGSGE